MALIGQSQFLQRLNLHTAADRQLHFPKMQSAAVVGASTRRTHRLMMLPRWRVGALQIYGCGQSFLSNLEKIESVLYANLADEKRSPEMNYEQSVAAEIVKVLREHGITVPDDKTMLDAIVKVKYDTRRLAACTEDYLATGFEMASPPAPH